MMTAMYVDHYLLSGLMSVGIRDVKGYFIRNLLQKCRIRRFSFGLLSGFRLLLSHHSPVEEDPILNALRFNKCEPGKL